MNYELHPEEDPNFQPALRDELTALLNRHSRENASGTPDYILAEMVLGVLDVYDETIAKRAKWRGENVELPALSRQMSVEKPQTHPDYEENTPWYLQN